MERYDEKEEKKQKWNQFKERVKTEAIAVKDWVSDHPLETAAMFTAGLKFGTAVAKNSGKKARIKEEKRHKERFIYDTRRGHSVEARRKLTPEEWEEFDELYAEGYSAAEILRMMRIN